jgi:hypothetical protein
VACCVKAIAIDVVTIKWLDPIGTAACNLSQLATDRRIGLGLQVRTGYIVILFERTSNLEGQI